MGGRLNKTRRSVNAPGRSVNGKSPYRVPTMAEIDAIEPCGYTVVSTFSGCGGSCLGFRMAGFRTVWASEFIEPARDVYALNHPGVPLDARDVREVQPAEILDAAGLDVGEVDVMEGSPPCASFSTAGKRAKGWGEERPYSETTQRVDDLFFEFARLVDGVRPRVFVAENVSGLVKGVSKGHFKEIFARLEACGYRVGAKLLDAKWLGVPQSRQRLIFVGVRDDLGAAPAFPRPLPYYYSIRDAIGDMVDGAIRDMAIGRNKTQSADLPSPTILTHGRPKTHTARAVRVDVEQKIGLEHHRGAVHGDLPAPAVMAEGIGGGNRGQTRVRRVVHDTSGTEGAGDVLDRPSPAITVSKDNMSARHFRVYDDERLDGYALGREAKRLRPGQQSDRYFNLVRPHPDQPSPTVTQVGGSNPGTASVIHPDGWRKFTIAELRRVCGFPDDFQLTGTYAQQWERLGRAVPPPMMAAVARAVRDLLRDVDARR